MFDLRTGRERMVLGGIPANHLQIAPDGSLVAALIESREQREHSCVYLCLWDVESGRQIERILVHDAPCVDHREDFRFAPNGSPMDGFTEDFCFAPDGNTLAYTSNVLRRREVTLWDVPTRTVRANLSDQAAPLAFSPDSRQLATTGGLLNERVCLWEVATAAPLVALEELPVLGEHGQEIVYSIGSIAFSTDGSRLGTTGGFAWMDRNDNLAQLEAALGDPRSSMLTRLVRVWHTTTGKLGGENGLPQRFATRAVMKVRGTVFSY